MDIMEQLKELGRALYLIDCSAISARTKYNRINRAVAHLQYFVATTDFSEEQIKDAQDYLETLSDAMKGSSWRLRRVIDMVGVAI